ncbi:hypothetical protein [Nocardioides aestuarii]|uniref:Uncharacterized protein n=1 Tax=Nocardioides aestuarii TaxID=252231 RepID=A0ABW4TJI4_9ACTN
MAASVVGAILAITPAASSTTQRDPACSDRFTTTGPLVSTCVERHR